MPNRTVLFVDRREHNRTVCFAYRGPTGQPDLSVSGFRFRSQAPKCIRSDGLLPPSRDVMRVRDEIMQSPASQLQDVVSFPLFHRLRMRRVQAARS